MNTFGTWGKVGKCPDKEYQTCPGPGEAGKAEPFETFAEIVAARDITVHAARGEIMFGIPRFPKCPDHMVGMDINHHARQKDKRSKNELALLLLSVVSIVARPLLPNAENPISFSSVIKCSSIKY